MRVKHPIILTVAALLMHVSLMSQNNPLLDKGDKAFDKFNYEEAMYFYESAHDASPSDPAITRRIANTYRRMGQLTMSAEWYRKTLELDPSNAQDMLFYAEALKSLQQYDEAIYWYENYDRANPNDSRAKSHLQDKFYYKDLFADTLRYDMKRQRINNAMPVISATLFEDEKILVSAVNFDNNKADEGAPYLDVYLCDFTKDDELANPFKLDKKVNSKFHDGPATYSFSERTLFITRTNMKGGRPLRDKNGNVNLKIFEAKYENGQWSSAQEWRYNDNNYSTGHPCLTKDGQTMYFVSTRPGGFGGSDIYVCYKSGNGWSEPVNLGGIVNTAGNEMFPFIGEDGFLYFTSDGHAGLGGLDIFSAELKNEVWQAPKNMGAPINTNLDDFALTYDKESDLGFFCSNRSGMGDDDIFTYKHIYVERMIVAGTLKAGIPNVSLVGERVAIKNLTTGQTTYQRLDEFERFEFSAMAGEQVEVYMINGEYFDEKTPAIAYTVPGNIDDPYVNTGNKIVALTKVPNHQGKLTRVENEGLADAKAISAEAPAKGDKPVGNAKDGKASTTQTAPKDLEASNTVNKEIGQTDSSKENSQGTQTNKVESSVKTDETTTGVAAGNFNKKIKEADRLLDEKKLTEARAAYVSASAIKPGEKYPKGMIALIDKQLDEEKAAKERARYDAEIKRADGLLADKKLDDAKAAYKAASDILPKETYPKDKILAIEKAKLEEQYAKNVGNTSKSDFDDTPAVIDLHALEIDNVIFDYNKALIRKDDITTLEKVAKLMKENPNTKLLIRAHCDSRGSLAYNQSLSMSRAMAVQGYLMQKGFKRDRFKAEWYGEQRSLNGCDDGVPCEEDQYEINRRAEFKLVEMK